MAASKEFRVHLPLVYLEESSDYLFTRGSDGVVDELVVNCRRLSL